MFDKLYFTYLFCFRFLLHSSLKKIGKYLWEVYLLFLDSNYSVILAESQRNIDSF